MCNSDNCDQCLDIDFVQEEMGECTYFMFLLLTVCTLFDIPYIYELKRSPIRDFC